MCAWVIGACRYPLESEKWVPLPPRNTMLQEPPVKIKSDPPAPSNQKFGTTPLLFLQEFFYTSVLTGNFFLPYKNSDIW